MKKLIIIAVLLSLAAALKAQSIIGAGIEYEKQLFEFSLNTKRFEVGINVGQAGSFSDYARFGMGANILIGGVYLDFIEAEPQHRYTSRVTDTKWNDNASFCINAGYQIPILKWLRIMPLVGYGQTNDGITDGSSIEISSSDEGLSWYHRYKVTPGSRTHYFNYGGGLSIQPSRWFSVNLVATRCGIYAGIALDVLSIARPGFCN